MKPQERIAQLEKENATKDEQIQGLLKKIKEMETLGVGKGKSKSRVQAEEGLKMLQAGPVTVAQLKTLNEKYPTDVVYFIRTMLKLDVKTVRLGKGNTVYMLPEQFATYQEGVAKEKAAKEASEREAKEEIQKAESTEAAVVAA